MHNIRCAVMTVGGWYDAEDLSGPMRTYYAVEKNNPGIANTIVEGPWVHGGWARSDGDHLGEVQFNAKTAEFFRKNIQFPFFEYYLKGKGSPMPEAYMFETGANVWRQYSEWPPAAAKAKTLYLRAGGKLTFDPPCSVRWICNGHCATTLYGRRPAIRFQAPRRGDLPDRPARRRHHHRRSHLA
jgi:putative CocE/NonD family hydrolase